MLDLSKVKVLELEGVNHWDYPDYCDAFISAAEWSDSGKELSDLELEYINENAPDFVYDKVMEWLF